MAPSIQVQLGRRLRRVREQRGLNQTQVADLARMNRRHLSDLENGRAAARIDTLAALATVLETTLSELFLDLV